MLLHSLIAISVWGDRDNSVLMSAKSDSNREHFKIGADVDALRSRFAAAGFSKVVAFRQTCILEMWDAERAALWWAKVEHKSMPDDREWLADLTRNYQVDGRSRGSALTCVESAGSGKADRLGEPDHFRPAVTFAV